MDAEFAGMDQRRAPTSSRAVMRNQLLHSDIGNIDITKEEMVQNKPQDMSQQQHQQPMQYPMHQPQQQYHPQQYGPPTTNYPVQYAYDPNMMAQQQMYEPQQVKYRQTRTQNYVAPDSRKSSMTSSHGGFSNFFKGKYKKFNKRDGGHTEGFNDDDDNVEMSEQDSSLLTFSDISSLRNNGGHAYGYGGQLDDTSPIIPTLVSTGNNPKNNVDYRKHMTTQRKMAFNNAAKQQQQQQMQPIPSGGPRTMSLQSYPRPMMRPGPGPMGPGYIPQPRIPPNGSRMNSLMNGPPPVIQRQGYPPQQMRPNDPRTMSLGGDRRPVIPMNGYPSSANGPQVFPVNAPVGSQAGNPDYPGHPRVPSPAGNPNQNMMGSGPRTLSLQNQTPPQHFLKQNNASQETGFDRVAQFKPSVLPQPHQFVAQNTSGSTSSYTSANSINSGPASQESTTPTTADGLNQVPPLPRSPLKYELHATSLKNDDDVSLENQKSTFDESKSNIQANDSYDSDSLVKLNILTLSESARKDLEQREQEEISKLGGTRLGHIAEDISLAPSAELIEDFDPDATPVLKLEKTSSFSGATTKNLNASPMNVEMSNSDNAVQALKPGFDRYDKTINIREGTNEKVAGESVGQADLRKSNSSFRKAKTFLMKIKSKGNDRKVSEANSQSSRNSVASSAFEVDNDTFGAKLASNEDRRKSYHSLFSSSSVTTSIVSGNHQSDPLKTRKQDSADKTYKPPFEIRKSMIVEESTEIKSHESDNETSSQAIPYVPSFSSKPDTKQSLLITSDQLGLLNDNKVLMQELQLISVELAGSIAREARLESELQAKNQKEVEAPQTLTLQDFEVELRKKSSKIVELIQQLNEERLRRFIAEEQNVLYQHGIRPSTTEMAYTIDQLKKEITNKDARLKQLSNDLNRTEND